jgi:hypothetical protein
MHRSGFFPHRLAVAVVTCWPRQTLSAAPAAMYFETTETIIATGQDTIMRSEFYRNDGTFRLFRSQPPTAYS